MAQATETKTTTAVADPAPLGLIAFATTTLVLSAANANLGINEGGAITMAFAFGGLGQLLAGMWEFKNGNTFGAAAFTSYGAFWISFWAYFTFSGDGALLGAVNPDTKVAFLNPDLAWYLLGWTVVTGVFLICTLRLNYGLVVVFALLFITFLLLTIGKFNPPSGTDKPNPIGGYVGFATAIAAYYVALAGLLKSVSGGKINLPVGPIGK